jgi:hypothetical protein
MALGKPIPVETLLMQRAIEEGWIRYDAVEFTLASGRKFRYQMED